MAEKARQVPVKISVGTGWATVETTGAALSISLPKNALKPKAVDAYSMSKIRELAATTIRTAPPTPKRHIRKKIGKAIESVWSSP